MGIPGGGLISTVTDDTQLTMLIGERLEHGDRRFDRVAFAP